MRLLDVRHYLSFQSLASACQSRLPLDTDQSMCVYLTSVTVSLCIRHVLMSIQPPAGRGFPGSLARLSDLDTYPHVNLHTPMSGVSFTEGSPAFDFVHGGSVLP